MSALPPKMSALLRRRQTLPPVRTCL